MKKSTVFYGIILAVSEAKRQDLLDTIEQCGSQWVNDIESDNLYIIVGDNLSAVGIGTIEALKYAWEKAKIFSVLGFKSHIKKKEVDDVEMFFCQSKNKLLGFCHRNGDCFKWNFKGIYPGPSIFHHKKMDEESGVLATMGYHVGNSNNLIAQTAKSAAMTFSKVMREKFNALNVNNIWRDYHKAHGYRDVALIN